MSSRMDGATASANGNVTMSEPRQKIVVIDDSEIVLELTRAVLERDGFQLTVHGLRGEPATTGATREDTYVKLCFPVDSLANVRREAAALGGEVWPAEREWESESRGFRACDGRDPEGNVFQAREPLAG